MDTTVQDLQRRLIALGFPLPKYGPDGDPGGETIAAIGKVLDELVSLRGGAQPTPVWAARSKARSAPASIP